MLGGELARRSENLKREQRQRAEAAQRKAEKEKIIQERLLKQRAAHEKDLRLKRAAEAAAAEQVRLMSFQPTDPPTCKDTVHSVRTAVLSPELPGHRNA